MTKMVNRSKGQSKEKIEALGAVTDQHLHVGLNWLASLDWYFVHPPAL